MFVLPLKSCCSCPRTSTRSDNQRTCNLCPGSKALRRLLECSWKLQHKVHIQTQRLCPNLQSIHVLWSKCFLLSLVCGRNSMKMGFMPPYSSPFCTAREGVGFIILAMRSNCSQCVVDFAFVTCSVRSGWRTSFALVDDADLLASLNQDFECAQHRTGLQLSV